MFQSLIKYITKVITIFVVLIAFIVQLIGLSSSSSYFTYKTQSSEYIISATMQPSMSYDYSGSMYAEDLMEEGSPSIRIAKTADKMEAAVGDVIMYKYEVQNTGDVPLDPISVMDDYATPEDTSDDITVILYESPDYIQKIASLEPGQTAYGKILRMIEESDMSGPIVSTATAKGTTPFGYDVVATAEMRVELYEVDPGIPEAEPEDTTPPETEPPETQPTETTPPEVEPLETEPTETIPPETEPPETGPTDTTGPETEPPEAEPTETTQADEENQSTDLSEENL